MERFRIHLPRFDRRHEEDEWPVVGEVPGADVPGVIIHNGNGPEDAEELEGMTVQFNNGHHPIRSLEALTDALKTRSLEMRAKRLEILRGLGKMHVLFRDGITWKEDQVSTGEWKIWVGSATAIGTAAGIYMATKKILEARRKSHK